jgi:ABC-type bacteriocin/lantibiotic exporter with double-glycine peptidase domain
MFAFLTSSATVNQLQNVAILLGGSLVGYGYLSHDQLVAIVGGAAAIITVVANLGTHTAALNTPVAPAK